MLRFNSLLIGALAATVSAQTQVTVNAGTTYQTMDGFGFSEAFGQASNFPNLGTGGSNPQGQALDYLFSKTTGMGATILRNRIPENIESSNPGCPTCTPNYSAGAWNGQDEGQVWFTQQARARGVKYVYADAWSAPAFMKTNNNATNGGYLCGTTGHTCSSGDWRQAYANFLVHYLQLYKNLGITIDFLGAWNEPDYTTNYSSMLSDGTAAASFFPYIRSTMDSNGFTNVGFVCCDAVSWSTTKTMIAQIQAAGAEQYLSRVSTHAYGGQPTTPLSTSKRIWETEYADLSDPWVTTWYSNGGAGEGMTWALDIYNALVGGGLSGYLYWWGGCLNADNSCLLRLVGTGNSATVTPSGRLWAFGLYSRYILPDSVRVGTSGAPSNTKVAAFKNTDGSIAVVMLNTNTATQSVSVGINGVSVSSGTAYYMSNSVSSISTLSSSLSGGRLTATLPGWSMVTFVLKSGTSTGTTSTASTTSRTTTTTTSIRTTSIATGTGQCSALYQQCGGIGWTGPTCCSGSTCKFSNDYYSQCL
ncbi:hypothetical protein TWF694_011306 [Orbilia ellipsospora]|uniref:CBM1 domain-containing protein n=1 Tax=Orbilia ellipsospora TaxID=2528407 RepID=A0AAV9X537_9PEZI